jgi:hypothetical protein
MIPFLPLLQYTRRKPPATPPKSEKILLRGKLRNQPEAVEQPEEDHHLVLH